MFLSRATQGREFGECSHSSAKPTENKFMALKVSKADMEMAYRDRAKLAVVMLVVVIVHECVCLRELVFCGFFLHFSPI